jgi:hypothetical protein
VSFQIHDFEQVALEAEALDAEGNEANVTFAWSSSDETVVAVQDNGDGSALAIASPGEGGLGDAVITLTVTDVETGDTHTGTFDITVVAGGAVTVNVIAGEVTPKG